MAKSEWQRWLTSTSCAAHSKTPPNRSDDSFWLRSAGETLMISHRSWIVLTESWQHYRSATPDTGISGGSREWETSLSYRAQIKPTVKIEISDTWYLTRFVRLHGNATLMVKTTDSWYKIITCSHGRELVAAAACCIICERRLVFHAALTCAFLSSSASLKYTIKDSCLNLVGQRNTKRANAQYSGEQRRLTESFVLLLNRALIKALKSDGQFPC